MATDYEALRLSNLHKYGHETKHLELFAGLYSDRTHFLFELLQNAEDAGATEVEFRLHQHGLELLHDGRLFTAGDVEGICGVGDGTKAEDLTKIGRFGIGFKSVYVYTATPEIHSGDEHFFVESYVRPHASAERPPIPPGTTQFWFPFNHASITASIAHAEIEAGLKRMRPVTLLFLRSIQRLSWSEGSTVHKMLERRLGLGGDSGIVTLVQRPGPSDEETTEESWLVFGKELEHPEIEGTRSAQRVEMALSIRRADDRWRVEPLYESPLVAFFPTERETHLGLLVQAPFRTTPARDNVPTDDPWNKWLIAQVADLLTSVLVGLRDRGMLDAEALEAMPHMTYHFGPETMLRPLYERLRDTLHTTALLPAHGDGFLKSSDARLARGAGLRDLVSAAELSSLLGSPDPIGWVTGDITDDRRQSLYRFLRDECSISEMTPQSFVSSLTTDFLTPRPDPWIEALYRFLGTQTGMIRQATRGEGVLVDRPIIRLEDGQQVSAFAESGRPNAYLPASETSSFPTVRRAVVGDSAALSFLRELGLKPPDAVAELTEFVLPRYESPERREALTASEVEADSRRIFEALRGAGGQRRQDLVERLRTTVFLRGDFGDSQRLALPRRLYFRSADLEVYLRDNPYFGFVTDSDLQWTNELRELGVAGEIRTQKRQPNRRGALLLASHHGHHERSVDGFDPSFDIEALGYALKTPTPERARVIWNVLCRHRRDLRGEIEHATNQQFANSTRREEWSIAGNLVASCKTAWLPGPDGRLTSPVGLSLEDLPAGFERDEALGRLVGMLPSGIGELSEQIGVPADLVRALADDPDLQAQFAAIVEKKRIDHAAKTEPESEDVDFAAAVSDSFNRVNRPGQSADISLERDESVVGNPDRRRALVRDEIAQASAVDSGEPQFTLVSRRVWNAKDSAVKAFLLEQYGGRCQICDAGFAKRNGAPYAEAIYLVPASRANWANRPGNVVCLCPTCAAKFQHGSVGAGSIVTDALAKRLDGEGGDGDLELHVDLCGEPRAIRYTERHLLDLQELLKMSRSS